MAIVLLKKEADEAARVVESGVGLAVRRLADDDAAARIAVALKALGEGLDLIDVHLICSS